MVNREEAKAFAKRELVLGPILGVTVAPVAGGVAFNNTFRESGEPVCWNFYRGNGGAVVISHEVGHTFGLHHDDTTTQGYYGGHGSGAMTWGPIMGSPYSQNICQWSKGDYTNANQHQDDLIQIGVFAPVEGGDGLDAPLHLEAHRIRSGRQTIAVTVPQRPALAGIDPHHLLDVSETESDGQLARVEVVDPAERAPAGSAPGPG